jgi:hypothetical protein
MLTDRQASYTPDMAALIDSKHEIMADEYGVPLSTARRIAADMERMQFEKTAEILTSIFATLARHKNVRVSLHGLLSALGADSLNGFHNQSEIAKDMKCTRALVSHYTVGWRDLLNSSGFTLADCTKFRKKNTTRKGYAESATDPVLAAKKKISERRRNGPQAENHTMDSQSKNDWKQVLPQKRQSDSLKF